MVTADEQSSSDFFDNDIISPLKPEDNDDDSDNSSSESDFKKHDTNIYITYEKKKWTMLSRVIILISSQALKLIIDLSLIR